MSNVCADLHKRFQSLPRMTFPFDAKELPKNGVYILYEKDELGHGSDRIVRIGTHTGENQLQSRLGQHFIKENKDRSIFRKNIGRCFLNKQKDPFMELWECNCNSSKGKLKYNNLINLAYQKEVEESFSLNIKHQKEIGKSILLIKELQKEIEESISQYIQNNFSFSVFEVNDKTQRLLWESKLIATVSLCQECRPSGKWLGLASTKQKIRDSGLWLVNELYKKDLEMTHNDLGKLKALL